MTEQELGLRNLLGKFLPLVAFVVANENGKYDNKTLREASVLTLSQYMCSSSQICENMLPLLFTALENESSIAVKSTILICLGDLAFRFPNSIEPWTDHIYSR